MPVHDWSRVDSGIFHAMHHGWIEEIARSLNRGILPGDYYALPEQHALGFGPDVLTLERRAVDDDEANGQASPTPAGNGGVALAAPKLQLTAESSLAFYRRKQKTVTVRHVSGDRVVAMVEIVSPGNKSSRGALHAFVSKSADLLERGIHLLVIDVHLPGKRDPNGIHAAIWDEFADQEYTAPVNKPLTLAAYEASLSVRAYVLHAAIGDPLPEMPLFLELDQAVSVPLEATYMAAFTELPRHLQRLLQAK